MYTTIKHCIPKTNQTKTSKSPNLITYFSFDSSLFTYPPSPLPFFTGWPPFDAFNANQKNNMHYFFFEHRGRCLGGIGQTDDWLTRRQTVWHRQWVRATNLEEKANERDSRVPLRVLTFLDLNFFPMVWFGRHSSSSSYCPHWRCPPSRLVFFIVYSRFILFLATGFFYARIFYLLALLHNKANKRMQALCIIHACRSRHHALRSHAKYPNLMAKVFVKSKRT